MAQVTPVCGVSARTSPDSRSIAQVHQFSSPACVAKEEDVPVVVHPHDPKSKIAIRCPGDGTRVFDTRDRTDPEVENAIDRRQERNPGPIMADAHDGPLGVFEDQAAGK